MIEVVFGRSAYGSLKVASSYYAQGKCCGRLGAQKSGGPVVFDGQQTDIYCFSLALSIGDISDDGTGEQRRAVLRHLISVDPSVDLDEQVDESLQKTKEALSVLIERHIAGDAVRIWYSHNPDELCGMYWLLAQIRPLNHQSPIYLVKLPPWEYGRENTVISRTGWGEIGPDEWERYVLTQEKVQPAFLSACAMKWKKLQEVNSPLRVTLNGHLQSMPEDIYDSFILREIEAQPDEFKMAVVIVNVLGKYQLGIGDAWIAFRVEKLIEDGLLEVVQEAPDGEPRYRRILRKHISFERNA